MNNVRPGEIVTWMKNHRKLVDVAIGDRVEFSEKWWAWWSTLQLDTRMRNTDGVMVALTAGMDWEKLWKPGRNGMLLVMLALTWWGSASNDESWEQAVVEVCAVLCCTNRSNAVRPKRDRASTDVGKGEGSMRSKRARK
jgi:hypothetical protein